MSLKNGLIVIGVSTALSILMPLAIYIINFRGSPISLYPSDWASFGQYMGGVVGPLISTINLAVIIYIAIVVYHMETNRERQMGAALARPLASLSLGDYENDIF